MDVPDLLDQLYRLDVDLMCQKIFGTDFEPIGKLLYPRPKYKTFLIKKKSGRVRAISEPRMAVKSLQKKLLQFLYEKSGEAKPCVHGFTKGRSVVTNALKHCSPKTRYVLNLDLEDFFPSITFFRVRGLLQARPFNFSFQCSTVLAQLCCYCGTLPQGAPTSPLLANLICRSLDKELMALAHRNRATYTRYCDDITFSFTVNRAERLPGGICSFDGSMPTLGAELLEIVAKSGFAANPEKTRISGHRNRMEVTGLTINKFPNVKRTYVDSIRGALHAWEKYGYEAAEKVWKEKPYLRQRRIGGVPTLHRVLRGKLLYLKMVRSSDDLLYTRLAEKYNRLLTADKLKPQNFGGELLPVSPVVRNSDDASNAVFVVECQGDHPAGEPIVMQGTAFAFGEFGLVTCEHVLRYPKPAQIPGEEWNDDGSEPYVDMLPNAVNELVHASSGVRRKFQVIARDSLRDLALLKVLGEPFPGMRHFSPLETPIERHGKARLLGFPNWTPGRKFHNDEASVVTSTFTRSGLARIEIDTLIRQGNSGGPLVDALYRLAGVAQQGATQAQGNNECLSVEELEKWCAAIYSAAPD